MSADMEIFTAHFLSALLQVVLVNIVLSGDNAVVIALAARNLPPRHRRLAVLWGSLGAIVLRVVLTIVAVQLLKVPFLQFLGALLLVWIAVKLLMEDDDAKQAHHAHTSLSGAIRTILIADVVMSLDNTLAIAGVAQGDEILLITGLALSIPLIVLGSTLIMKIMDRFPVVVYLGAGLIAWTAGEMIDSDAAVQPYLPGMFHESYWLPVGITVAVIGFGWWRNRRLGRKPRDVLEADIHAKERLEDKID
jgi:YjbE family integral membrane protein